jgi:uncharacterized protein
VIPIFRPDLSIRLIPPTLFSRRWLGFRLDEKHTVLILFCAGIGGILFYFGTRANLLGAPGMAGLAAVFAASTLSSIAGFAFSAICGAMLFHLLSAPVHVVQIMIVCSIAIQSLSVVTLRNAIDWRHLTRFLLGGIVGLPLGVFLLTHISSTFYLKSIGIFLIGYGLYMLSKRPASTMRSNLIGDYAAGLIGGVTGGFAGFPGAFVTIWCGLKGWDKDRQRGVYQPFILIMQVLALVLIALVGRSNPQVSGIDLAMLAYVPGALLGTWCGIAIFRRLTDLQFARAVNLLLIVSGAGLLSSGT